MHGSYEILGSSYVCDKKMIKILSNKIIYKNKWIRIKKKKIIFPNKGVGEYYSLDQNDYVYVILQTSKNLFPLVKQYRHAINKYTYEFPSGTLEKKETPALCAKKEVLEETGHKVETLKKLSILYPDSGRLGNKVHMFFATSKHELTKKVDKKEEIKVLYFTKNQIKKLIKDNKILHQPHIGIFYTAIVNKLIK